MFMYSREAAVSRLQARRAVGELLSALLEEAPQELRAEQERSLLLVEPGASRLVETLCLARPVGSPI